MSALILTDERGNFYIECQVCGGRGTVIEVDVAMRWNSLTPTGENTAVATLGDDYDWDHKEFQCTQCENVVTMPEGFEITDFIV